MSDKSDSNLALDDVLSRALDREIGTSLDSLHDLRHAVRAYTLNHKSRGMPLDQIMLGLSSVLMGLEDDRSDVAANNERRDPDLATKLRAWCSEDYSGKR